MANFEFTRSRGTIYRIRTSRETSGARDRNHSYSVGPAVEFQPVVNPAFHSVAADLGYAVKILPSACAAANPIRRELFHISLDNISVRTLLDDLLLTLGLTASDWYVGCSGPGEARKRPMRIAAGIMYAVLTVGLAVAQGQNGSANTRKNQQPSAGNDQTSSSSANKVATRTYKGDLVSANCAGNGGSTEARNAAVKNSGEADRASGNQGCTVSSSTSEFALKTKDGRTLRFDPVGNLRTQDALKNRKKWASAASSGKTIEAKVSGIENDGKLTVLSVH